MMKHIRKPGQAMVEFALILPLLLLIIVGIFEFGRVMFIYSNLFNAAREGVRYGVTNPRDYTGIRDHVSDKVALVNTADVTFILTVEYDTGPGTATFTDYDAVIAGNRVLVSIQYDVIPMTPLLLPIVSKFPLDTQAARTIQTIGTIITTPPPTAPPLPPDEPSISLSPTCGPTGNQTISVSGSNWTAAKVDVLFDGVTVLDKQSIGSSFTLSFSVDVTEGNHTVLVKGRPPDADEEDSATFTSPCAETPTETETETPTETETETETETPTETETETPTETETVEPTPEPIAISEPVLADSTVVSGTAETGQTVLLRVVQTGYQKSVVVGPGNQFEFTGVPALVAGYTIIVQGYGQQDTALVQGEIPTPEPTPPPADAYITIEPSCGPVGVTTPITVSGFNWPEDSYVAIFLDGNIVVNYFGKIPASEEFVKTFTADVTEGSHTIMAQAWDKANPPPGDKVAEFSIAYESPCSFPDLTVTGLTLLDTLPLTTYQKINVEVCVANQGGVDVPSLFWVDLFADLEPEDIPLDPLTFPSVDYVAVNGLPAGASISFTMWVEAGFPVTGTHTLTALADTWSQIKEADDGNNLSDPLSITLDVAGPAPTPTPIPSVPPGELGTIAGTTCMAGTGAPTGLVSVYIYDDDDRLVWSGQSATGDGAYQADLPAGTYVVVGQLRLGNDLYWDQLTGVNVSAGETTVDIDLYLDD